MPLTMITSMYLATVVDKILVSEQLFIDCSKLRRSFVDSTNIYKANNSGVMHIIYQTVLDARLIKYYSNMLFKGAIPCFMH